MASVPQIRLDAVGKHNIGLDPKPQTMAEVLACNPIDRIGLHMTDIDKYAPELHNPEITEPVGSGNVPRINYQVLGYLAAKRGEISQNEIEMFVKRAWNARLCSYAGTHPFCNRLYGARCRGDPPGIHETCFIHGKR